MARCAPKAELPFDEIRVDSLRGISKYGKYLEGVGKPNPKPN